MKQSMRRRAFRRSLADAGLGAFGPTLAYKAKRAKVKVVVVDRYFPSSQIHHNCTGKLTGAKLATRLTCDTRHVEVDRDENASFNIRDWSDISCGLVESSALFVPGPLVGTADSSDDGLTHHLERADKSSACAGTARGGKNKSIAAKALCTIEENPRKGTRVTCARKVTREQRCTGMAVIAETCG